jgi:2-methylaconitate isomerase
MILDTLSDQLAGVMEFSRIPVVVMRGGTSRGVFLHAAQVPERAEDRDRLLLDLMGSPHPLQIDGLGGGHSSTSKVMIVSRSDASDCDVDYLFAQVSVRTPLVDYAGNCGNLTAAVAHFAVEEGLVSPLEPVTEVRLRNRNTGARVNASVRVSDGVPEVDGDCVVAGVERPGSPITTTYVEPGGSMFDSALPTGRPRERIAVPGVGVVELSIVDVTNPMIFVRAADLGMDAHEDPASVNGQPALLDRVEAIRAACAVELSLATSAEDATATSPSQPKIALVGPPRPDAASGAQIAARAFSMQRMHHAFPVTGLLCLAAASALPGTIPAEIAVRGTDGSMAVGHAAGLSRVLADVEVSGGLPHVRSVSIERTARRILQGEAFVPARSPNRVSPRA